MRKIIIALFVLTLASTALAGDQCTAANSQAVAFVKETVTVSTSSIGLTLATYQPTTGQKAIEALVTVATSSIRVWYDGSAPTSTVGHLFAPGQTFVVCQAGLPLLKMIRDTSAAADAPVSVTYFEQK